jgi:hypothetical protein
MKYIVKVSAKGCGIAIKLNKEVFIFHYNTSNYIRLNLLAIIHTLELANLRNDNSPVIYTGFRQIQSNFYRFKSGTHKMFNEDLWEDIVYLSRNLKIKYQESCGHFELFKLAENASAFSPVLNDYIEDKTNHSYKWRTFVKALNPKDILRRKNQCVQ